MSTVLTSPKQSWSAYTPNENAPWNLARVVHLHRRAGFAATWTELQRDLNDGPTVSIDRILRGEARSQGVPEDFAATADLLGKAAGNTYEATRLRAWWAYRMYFTPDPLTERLTLMWHNHFATSNDKVRNIPVMKRQNELFRAHARAPFGELLKAVLHDPAILQFLDAPQNRKGHPNENLARELMELFTLGVGNYSEPDVKEAARALTGWTVQEDEFHREPARHDAGEKTILGQTGKYGGDDLLKILIEHPAMANRLALRLSREFFGEGVLDDEALTGLAEGLREHNLDIGWAVETILRSQAFFAEGNLRRRVTSPAEFVIGSGRLLEQFDSPPSTLLMADWSARLGQDLFHPPNVGGWAGGRRWISTQSMIGRANYAAALVGGNLSRSGGPIDVGGLVRQHGGEDQLESIADFLMNLTFGGEPKPGWKDWLLNTLGPGAAPSATNARRLAALTLASPEAQVM